MNWSPATWSSQIVASLVLVVAFSVPSDAAGPKTDHSRDHRKLDRELNERRLQATGESDVIVEFTTDKDALKVIKQFGHARRKLGILEAYSARIPNRLLDQLANQGLVRKVSRDREVETLNGRTAVTVGARAVQDVSGYTGAGIGIAVIDSGVVNFHYDLTNVSQFDTFCAALKAGGLGAGRTFVPCTETLYEGQRVAHFADFVTGRTDAYDDYGHGTHVAGTIAGNGAASDGAQKSIAPGASIIALKALDGNGRGTISNIIAAIDYALAVKDVYNIRVMNLSVGAGVVESYETDPLTMAAKRAVDAGIVVVAAAGNLGRAKDGRPQYGAITAPGNAPWVLTVGGSSTAGTIDRADDVIGLYSSRGPTMFDYAAKPDLVAPGTGTVSLSDPESLLYQTKPHMLLAGSGVLAAGFPYISLTGTSMAAPVVAGTVALMLEANPNLTPNLVKAILQFTAQVYPDYNWMTQGAGFLNAHAAVSLAEYFRTATKGLPYPDMTGWSRHVFWGNHRVTGGVITPGATAWGRDIRWGTGTTTSGQPIVWGENCVDSCDSVVWGNSAVWGPSTEWAGASSTSWGATDLDNVVWGNADQTNVVWGNSALENVVWGNECEGADCDNVVWGNNSEDSVVWGNSGDDDDNVVWGNSGDDEVLWDSFFRGSVSLVDDRTAITPTGGRR